MKLPKNIPKILIYILIILFLILAGVFIILNPKIKNLITNKKVTSVPSTINPDSSLSTFTNSTYKFLLNYPSNWVISNTLDSLITINTPERFTLVQNQKNEMSNFLLLISGSAADIPMNTKKASFKDWVGSIKGIKEITVAGDIPGFYSEGTNSNGSNYKSIYFQKDKFIYIANFNYTNPSELKIEQQIFDSLKFE